MTNKIVPEQRTFKLSGTMKKLRGANALNDRVQVRLYEGTAGFGCDKRCKLGHRWFTGWSLSRNRVTDYCCPTIDGQEIKQYKGPNGEIVDAYRIYDGCTPHQMDHMLKQINELAHKIVKFCDHYKTR